MGDFAGEKQRAWPVSQAAERLRCRQQKRDRERALRRKHAQKWGREVAAKLGSQDPELKQVIGFGSTYETWRTFREDSDIDLAIMGGNWSHLSRCIPNGEFKVTLVELELQNREFINHVLQHGEVLYEKQ
jgi:hypothetical protein